MELLTGLTGDGKTLCATKRMFDHLDRGGVVGCNFHLKPGFAWRMAIRSYDYLEDKKPLSDVAESFFRRTFLCGKPESIKQLARIGADLSIGPVAKQFDRKILLVLDEGQLYMGPDKYRENMPWLQFVTQSRKYKVDPLILAHDVTFIDAKLRKMLKTISQSLNLHEHWRVPGTNISWPRPDALPKFFPAFIRKRWSPLSKKVHFNLARFESWLTELYDTDELFDFDSLPAELEHHGILGPNPFAQVEVKKEKLAWPNQPLSVCEVRTRYDWTRAAYPGADGSPAAPGCAAA
jgi:hypothetical protein